MEYTPQLLEDAKALRQTLEDRGWVKNTLCAWSNTGGRRLYPGDDGEPDFTQGPVCMTGAAGATTESLEFLRWAWLHDAGVPDEWEWSPRGKALIEALLLHEDRTKSLLRELADFVHLPIWLRKIVEINDFDLDQDRALAWVDRVIAAAEEQLASALLDVGKAAPTSAPEKAPDLGWLTQAVEHTTEHELA